MIEAFVTNLGKYSEGELIGEWLKLPSTREDVQALFKRIGVDGVRYEEFFITDYSTEVDGLYDLLGEYTSLDELNYLAALLDELDEGERERFAAAVACGDYTGSLRDLINLAQNLDCYEYYPGVGDEEELGYCLVDDCGVMDVPEHIKPYFDYEAFGRDVRMEDGGTFKDGNYIVATGDRFIEFYDGRDIPEEYRIFASPAPEKPSILAEMEAYLRLIDADRRGAPGEHPRKSAAQEL